MARTWLMEKLGASSKDTNPFEAEPEFVSVAVEPMEAMTRAAAAGADGGHTESAFVAANTAVAAPARVATGARPRTPELESIYAEAGLPDIGYTALRVSKMLHSSHIRNMPDEVKRSSILLALEASETSLNAVIEDAMKRLKVLNQQERYQQKTYEEFESRKRNEHQKLQQDLERLIDEYKGRMQAITDEVSRERAAHYDWQLKKKQEEQRINEVISQFASESYGTGDTSKQ